MVIIGIHHNGKGFDANFDGPMGAEYKLSIGEAFLIISERGYIHLQDTEIHIDIRHQVKILCEQYAYENINRVMRLIEKHYPQHADIVGEMIAIKEDRRTK